MPQQRPRQRARRHRDSVACQPRAPLFVMFLVQQRGCGQIGGGHSVQPPRQIGAGHDHQRRPRQLDCLKAGPARAGQPVIAVIADIGIGLEPAKVGTGIGRAQLDGKTRISAFEFGQPVHQPLRGKPRHRPQPQCSARRPGADVARGRRQFVKRGRNPRVIGGTRLGQGHRAMPAFDKRHAQPVFQCAHVAADHGVVDPQNFGGAADSASAAKHLERAQRGKRGQWRQIRRIGHRPRHPITSAWRDRPPGWRAGCHRQSG